MAEIDVATLSEGALPLLPLSAGVVLPQTVATLALETDEAKAAAAAALDGDRQVCSSPAPAPGTPGSARWPGSRTPASCRTAPAR